MTIAVSSESNEHQKESKVLSSICIRLDKEKISNNFDILNFI